MSRLAAEREESVSAQVSRAFEDIRLGLAALCSTCATMVSVLLVVGIFYFAPLSERPDSLAGMLETLGAPAIGWTAASCRRGRRNRRAAGRPRQPGRRGVRARGGGHAEWTGRQSRGAVEAIVGGRARACQPAARLDLAGAFEPARMGGAAVSVKTVLCSPARPCGPRCRSRRSRARSRAAPRSPAADALSAGAARGPPLSPSRSCSSYRCPDNHAPGRVPIHANLKAFLARVRRAVQRIRRLPSARVHRVLDGRDRRERVDHLEATLVAAPSRTTCCT